MGKTLDILPVTSLDYRVRAEKRLPRFLFDYIDGGANDELTLASNVADFSKLRIKQRVLRDVSHIDASTILAAEQVSMPVVLAPIGLAGMMACRAEAQAVRVANEAGIPFTLSTVGICSLTEVKAAASKPFWFQLYMIRDRVAVKSLLERALAAGCTTLVFTVDLPIAGMRHRDTRNGMLTDSLRGKLGKVRQLAVRPRWIAEVALRGKPHTFGSLSELVPDATSLNSFKNWIDAQFDPSVTWTDIQWLRSIWPGKLLLKGILEVEDALAAAAIGADGLVVSNHGGRQLDSVASTITKLPAIADAVGQRLEVYMDGGVRSGVDVFKAIALGARGVLIGRPWIWALAGNGAVGLTDLLATFKREFEVAMSLAGVTRISDIRRELIDSKVESAECTATD
jgi:L-lactate dehydrogenase (cytochrome)